MVPAHLIGGEKAEIPTGGGYVNSAGTGSFLADANGFTFTGTVTMPTLSWVGPLDLTVAATGTEQALNSDLTMNHATAVGIGVDATAVQLTTARTGGYLAAFRSATTSLAGDLNSVKYYDYVAGPPTDGGGTVLHVAFGILGTGHDVLIDCSSAATGENDVVIPDDLASAFEIREAANTYLVCVTTNGSESVSIPKPLKVDGIRSYSGTTGTLLVNMTDNLADGFSVQEAANKYLTFVTTNGSEAVNVFKPLLIGARQSSPITGVQSIADNGTITLPTTGTNALVATSSGANKTGIILTVGVVDGQVITLINNSANSLTFAAAGTSNVADGTGAVLSALTAMRLTWDATSARWYHG